MSYEKLIKNLGKQPDIYDQLRKSIAPTIRGMEAEKEALVMQLFGGLPKLMPDGTKIRGEIHILLVGDPSTPASHPLRYIANLLPRSIYMSKRISSSGKPTIAVVKDEFGEGRWKGRWSLEAGALALADTGIACIDGLDKISPEDRSALHQAMEQQEISVVKEGIDVMLKSRCAVLGVANPKYGRFDEHQPLPDQIDMPPTLLSKFDLIFPIVDRPNKEADYLLEIHKFGEEATNEKEGATGFDVGTEFSLRGEIKPKIDPQLLRKYIVWAKRNVFPVLAGDATEVIKNYFLDLRHASAKSIQCAPRQLESLIRLAEASARARLSSEVEFSDAKRAIKIMGSFLQKVGLDRETGRIDIDIIATGKSRVRQSDIRKLIEIIKDLARKSPEGEATKSEIIGEGELVGIPPQKTEELLQSLRKQGSIYESMSGKWRLSKK